jgi:hypothetical protein
MNSKKGQNSDAFSNYFNPLIAFELVKTGIKLIKNLDLLADCCIFDNQHKMLLKFISDIEAELKIAKEKLIKKEKKIGRIGARSKKIKKRKKV